jgi:chromosome segregation ATPase
MTMSEKLIMQILEKVNSIETKVDTIETKLDAVETKVNTIETKLDAVETKVNTIETKLDAVEVKVDTIETKLNAIEIEFKQFKQALFEVHAMALETNVIVKRIEIIQDQQHRIIDLLSTRSIEQEATLKRIK